MNDKTVLSKEEVDALLNMGKNQEVNINSFAEGVEGTPADWKETIQTINARSLKNIIELTTAEFQNFSTSYFRKKMETKTKETKVGALSECLKERVANHIYSFFEIQPSKNYGVIVISNAFLQNIINLIYGGKISSEESSSYTPGKIGIAVAEKLAHLVLESFTKACAEYGAITCQVLKVVTLPNLSSKLMMEDEVHMLDISCFLKEIENVMSIMVQTEFFSGFIPVHKIENGKPQERNFWRTAIETQVADTLVTVNVSLSDIKIKVKDIMKLKEGDMIPISDPTNVFVCLNQVKLYRAIAGQSNSMRVVKITNEI